MKTILLPLSLLFALVVSACDRPTSKDSGKGQHAKNTQFAFVDAIPVPQVHTLDVVIDSRNKDHRDTHEIDLSGLERLEASSLTEIPKSLQEQRMGHDPRVHGLIHADILDVSSIYQADEPKSGLFFGLKAKSNPNLNLQTTLPLAYGDFSVWGFAEEKSHLWFVDNLRSYLELCSESIWVADFTYSRLQESYYWTIGKLGQLKSLSLPLHGLDFSSKELSLPPSLQRLVVYNTRIDEAFGAKIKHLGSLQELIFVGCWLDTHSSQPHWGNDHFERLNQPIRSELDAPVHPFNQIHANLVTLKFVDCDKKLLIATDYYTWPNLKHLEIVSSFDYPSQDGVWAFDYLKLEPNNSPHIHKDYFHSLSQIVIRNPRLGKSLSDSEIERTRRQLKIPKFAVSLPEDEDFSTWTHADLFALSMRRRFDKSKFEFNYSITHLR